MQWLPAVFGVLVMAAGWHYLFHSRASQRLASVENNDLNRLRSRLRRAGGLAMLALGICLLAGVYGFDQQSPSVGQLLLWTAVVVLLLLIVALALIDLRLTWKLRRSREDRP